MKKALVIFNPVAGAKKLVNSRKVIENTLKKEGYSYDFFETIAAKKQPLGQFLGKKYSKIIVSGGDGTVAEVTSFLIHNKIKTPLVIIPQGSANILALSLRLPRTVKAALMRGLNNEGKPLDAMMVNQKYYGTIATGVGYDTVVMDKTNRNLKRKIGFLAYLWTVVKTILIYRGSPYKITIDGKREVLVAKTIICFNDMPFLKSSGFLNIFVLNPRPIRDFFRLKKAVKFYRGKEITIRNKKTGRFQIDGNVFKGKKVAIKVMPKAFYVSY